MRMVKGLANAHAATHRRRTRRTGHFASVDDLWRRAGVPVGGTGAARRGRRFPARLGLARREALWAIKALRDEPLPLFAAAAAREDEPVAGDR